MARRRNSISFSTCWPCIRSSTSSLKLSDFKSSRLLTMQSMCYCVSACLLTIRVLSQTVKLDILRAMPPVATAHPPRRQEKQFARICDIPGEVRLLGGHRVALQISRSLQTASKPNDWRGHPGANSLRRLGKSHARPSNQPSNKSPNRPTIQPASRQTNQTANHQPRPKTD